MIPHYLHKATMLDFSSLHKGLGLWKARSLVMSQSILVLVKRCLASVVHPRHKEPMILATHVRWRQLRLLEVVFFH